MDDTLRINTMDDVLAVVKVIGRKGAPDETFIAGFDDERCLQVVLPVDLGGNNLAEWIAAIGELTLPGEGLLVVSRRPVGDGPVDRPEDEETWNHMVAACPSDGPVVLDWFVVAGRYAFSLAEFAQAPTGWDRWGIDFDLGKAPVPRRRRSSRGCH
ncbi:MAG: hypothetical protein GEU79_06355 [Acidimicrobiia bacterium]|nr:hypothetical protein [Acidimicrobiia bacterium]